MSHRHTDRRTVLRLLLLLLLFENGTVGDWVIDVAKSKTASLLR